MIRTDDRLLADVVVTDTLHGKRLDHALSALAQSLSRGQSRKLIEGGSVFVDNRRVRVCSRPVSKGQRIVCHALQESAATEEPRIVLLHEDFAVIDKPSRMAVEPTKLGAKGTLAEWAKKGVPGGALVTHRLDAATSGLILLARSRDAQAAFNRIFAERKIHRSYLAVGEPAPVWNDVTLDQPLDLKPAVTHATVIARSTRAAAFYLKLETGRTRQIRRHLSMAGCPVVGDVEAGGIRAARLLLHAARLEFEWNGTPFSLSAPLPPDWQAELDRLGFTTPSLETLLPAV